MHACLRTVFAPVQELEHQLVAAAEEKTKVQSKFHELSIKHRQLIETSPQVRQAGRALAGQPAQQSTLGSDVNVLVAHI